MLHLIMNLYISQLPNNSVFFIVMFNQPKGKLDLFGLIDLSGTPHLTDLGVVHL